MLLRITGHVHIPGWNRLVRKSDRCCDTGLVFVQDWGGMRVAGTGNVHTVFGKELPDVGNGFPCIQVQQEANKQVIYCISRNKSRYDPCFLRR